MQCAITLPTAASGCSNTSSNNGSMSSGKRSPFADLQHQQQAWSAGVVYPPVAAPPPPLFIRIRTKEAEESVVHAPIIVTAGSPCSSDTSNSSPVIGAATLLPHLSGPKAPFSTNSSFKYPKLTIKVTPTTATAAAAAAAPAAAPAHPMPSTPTSPAGDRPPRFILGCLPLPSCTRPLVKARPTVKAPSRKPAPTAKPAAVTTTTTSSRKWGVMQPVRTSVQKFCTSVKARFTAAAATPISTVAPPTTAGEDHALESFSSALSALSSEASFFSLPDSSPPITPRTSLGGSESQEPSHPLTELDPTALASSAGSNSTTAAAAAATAGPSTRCMGWPSPNVPSKCTCVDLSPQIAALRVSRPAIGCLLCPQPLAACWGPNRTHTGVLSCCL